MRDEVTSARRLLRARAREFAVFSTSTVLYQLGRFLFSLAAAGSLAAQDFTAWALVVALLAYAPSLLLGIANGMSRDLPLLVGRGDEQGAARVVEIGWTVTAAAVVVVAVLGVVAAGFTPVPAAVLIVSLLVSGTVVYSTQQFVLRSRLRFDAAGGQHALFGILAALAAAVLVSQESPDFVTAAAWYAAPLVVAVTVGAAFTPPTVSVHVARHELRRLMRIGFPIMLAGLVFAVFVTLDRWLAVTLFGAARAAPYALASLVAAAMLVIPSVISQQTYPRMAMARGMGHSSAHLRAMARQQGWLAAALTTPIAGVVAVFAWLAIPAALPQYMSAIPAVIVLAAGYVLLAYLTGYGNYLNVVGGQWRYLASQLVGVASAIALIFIGGRLLGLIGIALGMAAAHVVYGIMLRWMALWTEPLPEDARQPLATTGR